jgi:wobble nucleotide-excising tRNase
MKERERERPYKNVWNEGERITQALQKCSKWMRDKTQALQKFSKCRRGKNTGLTKMFEVKEREKHKPYGNIRNEGERTTQALQKWSSRCLASFYFHRLTNKEINKLRDKQIPRLLNLASDPRPAKLLPTFGGRSCYVVRAIDPHGR